MCKRNVFVSFEECGRSCGASETIKKGGVTVHNEGFIPCEGCPFVFDNFKSRIVKGAVCAKKDHLEPVDTSLASMAIPV